MTIFKREAGWRRLAGASVLALSAGQGLASEAMAACTPQVISSDTAISSDLSGTCYSWTGGNISITNFGVITGYSSSNALVGNNVSGATLTNSGTITAPGASTVRNTGGGSISVLNNAGLISGSTNVVSNESSRIGTLTNSGTIRGETSVYNSGTIATLTNSGSITSFFSPSVSNNGGTIGTLGNLGGTISGSLGVYNTGTIGTLTNSGSISGTASYGVSNDGGTIGTLSNLGGTISGGNRGVYNSGGVISVLNNTGVIRSTDTTSSSRYGLYSGSGTIGTLSNSGTISGNGYGVVIKDGQLGTLANSGTITGVEGGLQLTITGGTVNTVTNSATGSIVGGTIGLLNRDGTILGLDNGGLIKGAVTGSSASAIGLHNRDAGIATVTNSGTIMAVAAIYNQGGSIGTLVNSGLVAGSIVNTGTNGLNISGGSGATFGTLTGVGGGIGSSDIGTISSASAGLVFRSGNILLNDAISAAGQTVTNIGAALKVANAIAITGTYNQTGGTLVSGASSPSTYGYLDVSGDASVANAAVVISGAGLSAGNSFTIVRSGGSGAYTNDTASVDVTTGLTAAITTVGNNLVVTLAGPPSPPPPSPPEVTTPTTPVVTTPTTPAPPVVTTPTGVIDTSKPTFTNEDGAVQTTTVTFDGGTLKPATALTLTQSVNVNSTNGFIDSNGVAVTLSGAIGGQGALTVSGSGSVAVLGNVTNSGGISVQQGGNLSVGSGGTVASSLTASGGHVTVANGGMVTGALAVDSGSATVNGIVAAPVTVSNGGSITVNAGGGIAGTGLSVTNGSVTVANSGIVSAPVTVNSGGTATVGGAVMAPVTVTNGGTLAVEGTGSTGAITIGQGGTAKVDGTAASTVTVAANATLSGNGTILGATSVSGVLSPGNSPGVLTARSAVTLTGTSAYRVEIDGLTAGTGAGHHDQVMVQGAAFTAAGLLTPVLRGITGSATNSFTATLGNSFTIVTADGGISGSFDGLTQPTDGLTANTRLDALYDATAIRLVVTPGSYAAAGGTTNQRAVGAAVDAMRPAAGLRSGATVPLFSGLYGLNASQLAGALDQLSGRTHADSLAAGLGSSRLFGQAVSGRLAALRDGWTSGSLSLAGGRSGGVTAGAAGSGATGSGAGWGRTGEVWGQPLAAYARTRSDGNAGGSEQRIGGFLAGVDRDFETGERGAVSAGVALGYLRNRTKAPDVPGKSDIDSYQGTLYASWNLGGPYVEGTVGYGYNHYESERAIAFGSFASGAQGKANGHNFSAKLAAGHRMVVDGPEGNSWVEPRVALQMDRILRDGFTEAGGSAVLRVDSAVWTSVRSAVGLRVGTSVELGGLTVRPTASVAWLHDFGNATATTTNQLGAVSFTVDSSRVGRDAALIGAGAGIALGDGLTATLNVQDEVRKHENVVSATAGLRWKL